ALFIALLCFSAGFGCTVDCVKRSYDSQVGVREATGRNDGPEVASYLKAAGISQPVAWCGAFVKWAFSACCIETTGNAWAPSWFPASKTIWKQGKGKEPGKSDVFGIWFSSKN